MSDDKVTITERLCLTEDGNRVVPEGHPDGRWLWRIPGAVVSRKEAERLGVVLAAPAAESESAPVEEPVKALDVPPAPPKRRGRPPGSRNKPKPATTE